MEFNDIRMLSMKLVEITKAAILNQSVEIGEDVDITSLVEFAKFHSIENLLYEPLAHMAGKEEMKQVKEFFFANITLDTKQMYQLERICACFEENCIRFLPLKGSVMKYIYPETYKRKSSDIDIYVFEDYDRAKELLKGLGFVQTDDDHSVHGSFYSEQVEVELHHNIINNKHQWSGECGKIPGRTVLAEGYKYKYEMTLEDYYFYMIAHMAKHIKTGGAGIRFIMDIWVYLEKYGNVLDWEKLDGYLSDAGLYEFNKCAVKIMEKWYMGKDIEDDSLAKLEVYIRNNGWIGTLDSNGKSKVLAKTRSEIAKNKIKGALAIAFPSLDIMKKKYTVLDHVPLLLPVYWIIRAVKVIIGNRELIKSHTKTLDYGVDDVMKLQEMFDEIGL